MEPRWSLLFHQCLIDQLDRLTAAANRARAANPKAARENTNVKLQAALARLILETIPADPASDEFRQGNALGADFRHWRRAKIGRRFRLFFRYDSRSRVIVYAWVNDENTLRSSGSKTDPYAVFLKMLERGDPPDEWNALIRQSKKMRF